MNSIKCNCFTDKGKPCTKNAKYKMVLIYNNETFYCCGTHIKKYLDKTRSFYYSVKNIEKL